MKRVKMSNRILSCVLIFLFLNIFVIHASAEEDRQEISINNVEEFLEFTDACTLDSYSKDKTVTLNCDLDLTGVIFVGVPIFSGVFDGNNHTISGLDMDVIGSRYGLFGIVDHGGEINNLYVKGKIFLNGSESTAGLIAGDNYGTISNCHVSGNMEGYSEIGGLVGVNHEGGTIKNCISEVEVNGFVSVGGITGLNYGSIDKSSNRGNVNTIIQSTSMISDIQKSYGTKNAESFGDVTDTGGIAGVNEGTILNCKNYGTIGYDHIGYNTGGIAGRHNGMIVSCSNEGLIYGRKDIGGIVGQFEPHILIEYGVDKQAAFESSIHGLNNSIDRLGRETSKLYDDSEVYLNNIVDANSAITGALEQYQNESTIDGILNQDSLYTELYKNLGTVNDNAGELLRVEGEHSDDISSALNSMSNQMDSVGYAFSNLVTAPVYEVSDTSEERIGTQTPGQVKESKNSGVIYGDRNVGGIIGNVGLEVGNDPEEDFYTNNQLWIDTSTLFNAIVSTCRNEADITAKYGGAGGITGSCDLGVIHKSINTGDVEAENEEYCGGIAGYSNSGILDCHVFSKLTGSDSVGGIAGTASKIVDCTALVVVDATGEKIGSIAGLLPEEFSGNVYADSDIPAIDRIDYDGKAYAISNWELKAMENVPNIYSEVQVKFLVEGKIVKSINLGHGYSLPTNWIPIVPEKEGNFGEWESFEQNNIVHNLEIQAVYKPWIKTISTQGEPAKLLCEGNFSPEATLMFTEMEKKYPSTDKVEFIEAYDIQVIDTTKELDDKLTYRMKYGAVEDLKLAFISGEEIKFIDYRIDGSYLVFNGKANVTLGIYKEVKKLPDYVWYIIILIILIVFGLIFFFVKRKKNTDKALKEDS